MPRPMKINQKRDEHRSFSTGQAAGRTPHLCSSIPQAESVWYVYIYIIYVWSGLTTAAGIVASAGHTEKPKGGSSEAGTHGKTKKRVQLNARQLLVFPVSWRAQGSGLRFAQHQHQDCIPAAQRRRKAPGEHSRSRSSGGRSPNTESSNRTNSWS